MLNDYHLINDNELVKKTQTNYKQILSKQEKQILKELNSFSEETNKKENYNKKFYNLSLKKIFENFLDTWKQIIEDLVEIFKKKKKYKKDIYSQRYWWDNIQNILFQIFYIITQQDRLIYVGIMLIIISFLIYFIVISS